MIATRLEEEVCVLRSYIAALDHARNPALVMAAREKMDMVLSTAAGKPYAYPPLSKETIKKLFDACARDAGRTTVMGQATVVSLVFSACVVNFTYRRDTLLSAYMVPLDAGVPVELTEELAERLLKKG